MDSEKKKLEEAACRYFLDVYNRQQGTNFRIARHGDRPDFLIEDGEQTLGLEVTHLYYGGKEAQILLGRSDKLDSGVQIFSTLTENLNALLADKAHQAQGYDISHPVILVIRVASPVFNDEDFAGLADETKVPGNLFTEIWLLARDDETGSWMGLEQLK